MSLSYIRYWNPNYCHLRGCLLSFFTVFYLRSLRLLTIAFTLKSSYEILLLMTAMLLSSTLWAQQWAREYDNFDDFSNGLSLVTKGGKKGFVINWSCWFPVFYEEAMHFNEGMAAVKKEGKWGFLDSTGNEVVPANLMIPTVFQMAWAWFQKAITQDLWTGREGW